MSELAYNINGEGFELPETATGWRVRRMKPLLPWTDEASNANLALEAA